MSGQSHCGPVLNPHPTTTSLACTVLVCHPVPFCCVLAPLRTAERKRGGGGVLCCIWIHLGKEKSLSSSTVLAAWESRSWSHSSVLSVSVFTLLGIQINRVSPPRCLKDSLLKQTRHPPASYFYTRFFYQRGAILCC